MEMKYYAMKFNLKEMKIPPISQFPRYFGGGTVGTIYNIQKKKVQYTIYIVRFPDNEVDKCFGDRIKSYPVRPNSHIALLELL